MDRTPTTNGDHDIALERIQEARAIVAAIRVSATATIHKQHGGLSPEEIIALTGLADGLLDEAHALLDKLETPK